MLIFFQLKKEAPAQVRGRPLRLLFDRVYMVPKYCYYLGVVQLRVLLLHCFYFPGGELPVVPVVIVVDRPAVCIFGDVVHNL